MGLLSDLFYGITGAKKLENMGLFTPVAMHRDTNDEYKVVEAALYDEKQKDNYKVDSVPFDINIGEVIDMQEDTQGIESDEIDADTERNFGDKPMIVLS